MRTTKAIILILLSGCGQYGRDKPAYAITDFVSKEFIAITIHRPYRGYCGIGSCGGWVSYEPGEKTIRLILPERNSTFTKNSCSLFYDDIDFRLSAEPKDWHKDIARGILYDDHVVITIQHHDSGKIDEYNFPIYIIPAQQVDSAEASTIAVPPSNPSGSPR